MNELKQRTNSTNASEHLDHNWLTLLESAINITAKLTLMIIPNWQRTSHDSDDDFHSVCPSSSHCQH